ESGKDYGYPLISGYFDDNYQYCNWAPSQICIDSPTGWKDTDNTCPAGVIPLSESDSYPSGPPANFMPPIGTYNSSKDSNGDDYDVSGGWLTWPTVAPSGIMIYEAGRIPCWEKSLIIPTLKRSTIYRVELNTTGDGLANQNYEEFHSTPKDRYRDIIVAPDGITFYAITDNSGGTSGPSGGANGGGSVDHKGVIAKIQYTGDVNWYADSDGDGYGDINTITVAAANAQPVGYVSDNTDCDDTPGSGSAINPDTIWYADTDGDGYGDSTDSLTQCTQPAGYVLDNTDCDDADANINPDTIWYADTDGDGDGDSADSLAQCTQPARYVLDNTDCDDADTDINPDTIWYADTDGDGFGDSTDSLTQCTQPAGYVLDNTDCDDADTNINPDTIWYADTDGDGYGDSTDSLTQCTQPDGYALHNTDCDDTYSNLNPDTIWYADGDGDGYGDSTNSLTQCEQPVGYVLHNSDCDDADANINPDTIWYADTDGDGFGDSAESLTQC